MDLKRGIRKITYIQVFEEFFFLFFFPYSICNTLLYMHIMVHSIVNTHYSMAGTCKPTLAAVLLTFSSCDIFNPGL